jgi:pyridoxamine 5'-phosphate oxidase
MLQTLNETDVDINPVNQFSKWWQAAVNSSIDEVNAFTLATATTQGKPSARILLLKGFDENGFIFFT